MKNIMQTSFIKKVNLLAHVNLEYLIQVKFDPGLKQCDQCPGFSLSISQFSMSNLGQALSSCTQYEGKQVQELFAFRFKSRANFLVGLEWITVARGIGYIRWPKLRTHVPPLRQGLRCRWRHLLPPKARDWSKGGPWSPEQDESVVTRTDVLYRCSVIRCTNNFKYYFSLKKEFYLCLRMQSKPY